MSESSSAQAPEVLRATTAFAVPLGTGMRVVAAGEQVLSDDPVAVSHPGMFEAAAARLLARRSSETASADPDAGPSRGRGRRGRGPAADTAADTEDTP